ncbi:MAG: NUDIX domain-containing protein [Candidatus Methylacidiphilales bacterium]
MNSSDEWFDVVDEQDRPIGRASRHEVHARALRHRAVHIWILGTDDRLLIQKRSASKDRHPSVWDSSASGHVDAGESYERSARRETSEELGINPPPELTLLGKIPASIETDQEFVCLYLARHNGPFVCPPDEIERVDWIAPDTLTQAMSERPAQFAPCFRHLWKTFSNALPSLSPSPQVTPKGV